MGLPKSKDAKQFWRSAKQRFADGELLLKAGRTTGAVYLAGYSVECMLKAMLIEATPKGGRVALVRSFRGAKAHDFEWLRYEYRRLNCPPIPPEIHESFLLVSTWSTEYRYHAGTIEASDAENFVSAAEAIIRWADGRM